MQLNVPTVNKHAQRTANGSDVALCHPDNSNRRKNIFSPQSVVATTLLLIYVETNRIQCPTGGVLTTQRPLTSLPSHTTGQKVDEKYWTSSKGMMDFYKSKRIGNKRSTALASTTLIQDSFLKI